MNLQFDLTMSNGYRSNSQIARVLTEQWVSKNSFCPNCGSNFLSRFDNNRPAADFYCVKCSEEYELKSKKGAVPKKVIGGAYDALIDRMQSDNNPNFFFLTYSSSAMAVENFLLIPKYYFIPNCIEKRKPLSVTARRAGWIGCNILFQQIPEAGKIFLVKNSEVISRDIIKKQWHDTIFLKSMNLKSRGWLLDVISCVERIHSETFYLDDVYKFELELKSKYPNNHFIRDKIRQQLQILRDKGMIEFISRGLYRKIK